MATIDIRTTQNVTITYELANVRDRLLAFLIDFFLIYGLYYILLIFTVSILRSIVWNSGFLLAFLIYLFPIFLFLFYNFSLEVVLHGQTLGKRMMGIKVVRLDGKEPGLTDYLLRAVFYLIDVVLCMGVIASLLIGTTARRQRLGDITAHTTLVRIRSRLPYRLPDLRRIDSLEGYIPQYPSIRQISEQDMLLVKTTLARYQSYANPAHREAVDLLSKRMAFLLGLPAPPRDQIAFLKTLIKDYVVLTR